MLGACAGQSPDDQMPVPVSVVRPADAALDCSAILAEVQANDAKLRELDRTPGLGKVKRSLAVGEATASLQARQSRLGTLAKQRACS
jgi:hypothetical protein